MSSKAEKTRSELNDLCTKIAPIENALYATGAFTTIQCTELAEGIFQYLEDANIELTIKNKGERDGKV